MHKATEYDSQWKEAWRIYFHSFMRLCFPKVERAINWSRPPEFLDKELRKIVRGAESGKKFLDLLIKVWLRNGLEEWIRLHVEIQHRPDPHFEVRLYRYNYRAIDVYGRPVITLAVLADTDPNWRPTHYEMALPGLQQGQVIAAQQAVLELLEVRFGAVPEELRERVNAERNCQRLRRWHRLAATCPALKDLRLARRPARRC